MRFTISRPARYLIALVYYLLVVLPHEQVGLLTIYVFGDLPRSTYDAIILGFSLLGLLGFLWWLRKALQKEKGNIPRLLFYLSTTLLLCILAFRLLIIVNIEAVHFVQYGLMAILLFPLIRHYGKTLFWVTILGALDEAFQYFYLAPQRTNYYDFNDVLINLLGGALGLIAIAAQGKKEVPQSWKAEMLLLTIATGTLLILYVLGLFQVHSIDPETDPAFLLIRVPSEGFWTTVHPNITYHVVKPMEGLILTTLLLLFYSKIPTSSLIADH